MVSTRQARKTRKLSERGSSPADSGEEYEEKAPEPSKTGGTKRVRASKTTVKNKQQVKRRKKAKLSMLPDMPIDILYEIFSLVHPRDLMRISWTSKALNKFLTSKSSRHVWQASFNEGIPEGEKPPPCPSGITEMAYARLVYSESCTNCGIADPGIAAWPALAKLCGPCLEEIATDLYDAPTDKSSRSERFLPVFRVRYTYRGWIEKVLLSDSKRLSEELAAAGESSRESVLEKWESLVRKRDQFSDAMIKLEELAEQAKVDARENIQNRRIERIWEKLSEDGWHEEITARKSEYEHGLLQIKGVMMFRPLGEKAWAELRKPLNEFMKTESERVRFKFDTAEWRFRKNEIGKDVCWIPEVQKTLIDGTRKEMEDCVADIQSRLSELSATWLEERKESFLELVPRESPSPEHLSLATTMFDCTKCREYGMRIESAVSHTCHWVETKERCEKFSNGNGYHFYRHDVGSHWNRKVSVYRYSADLSALAREIVLECGEDPDTITTEEMNRKHHRFACFGTDGKITVLSWFQAFQHKCARRTVPCRVLRPDELPEYVPDPEDGKPDWGCLQCWGAGNPELWGRSFCTIRNHLVRDHEIGNPVYEEDYFNRDPIYTVPFKYKARGSA